MALWNEFYSLLKGDYENVVNYPSFFRKYFYLTIPLSVVYISSVLCVRKIMRNREKWNLRIPLFLWSSTLSLFSLFAFVAVAKDILDLFLENGLQFLLCNKWYLSSYTSSYWIVLYLFSKFIELGDTFFIVLRKQQLTFLHLYHHFSVLIFSWFLNAKEVPIVCFFGVINCFVHFVMYGYFSMKALRVPVPRLVSVLITFLQISQMVVCLTLLIYSFHLQQSKTCNSISNSSFNFAMLIYASYFYLFGNFFYESYIKSTIEVKIKTK